MDFAQPITNNLKKFVSSLRNKKHRDESGLFIAEGEKLCSELQNCEFHTEMIVLRSNFKKEAERIALKFHEANVPVYLARKQQFDQLCDTVSPQDILAVAYINSTDEKLPDNFIALDGINDPGNLGTIIRTADWFGFNNIILGPDCVDKFNSKVVRSSMGSLFRMNIMQVSNLENYLRDNFKNYEIYGAMLTGKKQLQDLKPAGKYGVVFGSEAHSISKTVRKLITTPFIISGFGGAESLNVGISVGITLFHFSKNLH